MLLDNDLWKARYRAHDFMHGNENEWSFYTGNRLSIFIPSWMFSFGVTYLYLKTWFFHKSKYSYFCEFLQSKTSKNEFKNVDCLGEKSKPEVHDSHRAPCLVENICSWLDKNNFKKLYFLKKTLFVMYLWKSYTVLHLNFKYFFH